MYYESSMKSIKSITIEVLISKGLPNYCKDLVIHVLLGTIEIKTNIY